MHGTWAVPSCAIYIFVTDLGHGSTRKDQTASNESVIDFFCINWVLDVASYQRYNWKGWRVEAPSAREKLD